jgi:tetratricopeptide (TPR) repeat protein
MRGGRPSRGERPERPEPRTEAERRAAEVRASRGPRRTPSTPESERAKIESREVEQWVDEGSLRAEAEAATARAVASRRPRSESTDIDPEVVAEIHAALDPQRAKRLSERLAMASDALDRERFDEARRITYALAKELPTVASVHEVHGLASYRLGRWKQAAASLELARQLRPDPALLPVLADCYRALRRWLDVESVWRDIKAASPTHEVMTEGRIVMAGALADRGDLKAAIGLLTAAEKPPKRVRDHHLRQWYVLADLYDRAGDAVAAARWFREIAVVDPEFADVRERLRALGR